MPYTVEYLEDKEVILAVFSGDITLELLTAGRQEVLRTMEEFDCDRLLVDAQDFRLMHSVADEYQFTSEHHLVYGPNTRIAVVAYAEAGQHFEFIENVAQNRGTNLVAFPSRSEALKWLLDDESQPD